MFFYSVWELVGPVMRTLVHPQSRFGYRYIVLSPSKNAVCRVWTETKCLGSSCIDTQTDSRVCLVLTQFCVGMWGWLTVVPLQLLLTLAGSHLWFSSPHRFSTGSPQASVWHTCWCHWRQNSDTVTLKDKIRVGSIQSGGPVEGSNTLPKVLY